MVDCCKYMTIPFTVRKLNLSLIYALKGDTFIHNPYLFSHIFKQDTSCEAYQLFYQFLFLHVDKAIFFVCVCNSLFAQNTVNYSWSMEFVEYKYRYINI